MRIIHKIILIIRFIGFYLLELFLSNMKVLHDVLTPAHRMRPGIIAVPLDARTDLEILIFSNLLTMTPGTLSLEISQDRKVLFVHAMYVEDADRFRQQIKNGFEARVLEILR